MNIIHRLNTVVAAVAVTASVAGRAESAADAAGAAPAAETQMVTLKTDSASCEVCLLGARLVSLKLKGEDVFWNDTPPQLAAPDWAHGGLPVCWPYFGRKAGGPIHGTAWRLPFRVASRTDTKERCELVLAAQQNDCDITYRLVLTDRLSLSLTTRNRRNADFPFSVGFHPYFLVGDRDRTTVLGLTPQPLAIRAEIDTGFPISEKSQVVRIVDAVRSRTIALKSTGFPRMNVWNAGAPKKCPGVLPGTAWKNYISVEPYLRQNERKLAPGEMHTGTFEISVRQMGKTE